tara:strand:- start:617 stop:802 length:186 start_codon:yes stop_codon:yes gene_type:complete
MRLAKILIIVDLPLPFGPKMPKIELRGILKETSSRAFVLLKFLVMLDNLIIEVELAINVNP